MKKLSLNLDFAREELSKEEMKKINGGFANYCGNSCSFVWQCGIDNGGHDWGTDCPDCSFDTCR